MIPKAWFKKKQESKLKWNFPNPTTPISGIKIHFADLTRPKRKEGSMNEG